MPEKMILEGFLLLECFLKDKFNSTLVKVLLFSSKCILSTLKYQHFTPNLGLEDFRYENDLESVI